MSLEYVAFHKALTQGHKLTIPRPARFIYLELSLAVRAGQGRIPVPFGWDVARCIHAVIHGDLDEITEAVPYLTAPDPRDGEPMIRVEDGELVVVNWERWNVSPGAKRVAKHREKKRENQGGTEEALPCNAPVTACNAQSKEKESKEKKRGESAREDAPPPPADTPPPASEAAKEPETAAPPPSEPLPPLPSSLSAGQLRIAQELLVEVEAARDLFRDTSALVGAVARAARAIESEPRAEGFERQLALESVGEARTFAASPNCPNARQVLARWEQKVGWLLGDLRKGRWKLAEVQRERYPIGASNTLTTADIVQQMAETELMQRRATDATDPVSGVIRTATAAQRPTKADFAKLVQFRKGA